ncbi:unnamed protein product [Ixodes persulcatus]
MWKQETGSVTSSRVLFCFCRRSVDIVRVRLKMSTLDARGGGFVRLPRCIYTS